MKDKQDGPNKPSEKTFDVIEVTSDGAAQSKSDQLAVEDPMEIRIVSGPSDDRRGKSLSITMRTPGNDFELAAGFLFTEGIVANRSQIVEMEFCGPMVDQRQNIVRVYLAESHQVDVKSLQRNFYTTSSCGICGKASLDAIRAQGIKSIPVGIQVDSKVINGLPGVLRASQTVFHHTGGIHAAGFFDASGNLISLHEDVGRHNAVDKLIGNHFVAGDLDFGQHMMVVSGRASFELVQKAATAGVPVLIAVGAPSSLAVELAEDFGITLLGFTSTTRFNIYSGAERIRMMRS